MKPVITNRSIHAASLPFCFAVILFVQSVPAQMSIGFRDPKNIRPVLDYRLPSWGYKTLSMDFSFQGQSKNDIRNYTEQYSVRSYNNSLAFGFEPGFYQYHESEKRIHILSALIGTNLNIDQQNQSSDFKKQQTSHLLLSIRDAASTYFKTKWFVITDADFHYYTDRMDKTMPDSYIPAVDFSSMVKIVYNRYSLNGRMGVGTGRVRNVTPLIRAMRLTERFHAVHIADSLVDKRLQQIAETISKSDSYEWAYDRPNKYFWRDVFNGIAEADKMNPFEFNYLADVMDENIGSRLQGRDLKIGFLIELYGDKDQYKRFGENAFYSRTSRTEAAGVFAETQWHRNPTLNQQVSTSLSLETKKMTSRYLFSQERVWNRWESRAGLDVDYLYGISDRILWKNYLYINYYFVEAKNQQIKNHHMSWIGGFVSTISYFVENHLSLSTILDYTYSNLMFDSHNNTDKNYDFNISISLKYYFLRGME